MEGQTSARASEALQAEESDGSYELGLFEELGVQPHSGRGVARHDLVVSALPDDTAVPNTSYEGLNLFFGLLILVAPAVYTATQRPESVNRRSAKVKEPQYHGYVVAFLAACALTLAAVVGELATVTVLFWDIETSKSLRSRPCC